MRSTRWPYGTQKTAFKQKQKKYPWGQERKEKLFHFASSSMAACGLNENDVIETSRVGEYSKVGSQSTRKSRTRIRNDNGVCCTVQLCVIKNEREIIVRTASHARMTTTTTTAAAATAAAELIPAVAVLENVPLGWLLVSSSSSSPASRDPFVQGMQTTAE